MKTVFEPALNILGPEGFDFCPGCGYGSVAQAIESAASFLPEAPVFVVDIGCVDFMITHLPGDVLLAPHGRAIAVAAGYKRVRPEKAVVCVLGDGAFSGIGTTEAVHCVVRGENITAIILNNGVLADTGGQMGATTRVDQVTTTTPKGRTEAYGTPIRPLEFVADVPGLVFGERVAIHSVKGIRDLSPAIRRALEAQMQGHGTSLVEVLSPCPTHWRMESSEAWDRVKDASKTDFPTGIVVDRRAPKEEAAS